MTQTYTRNDLDFSEGNSLPVISSAQKFVIFVPPLEGGGEPLVYPAGHRNAGAPIADWEGKPIGERGIVFFNPTDRSVQAVPGDGTGVVIINQVTEDQAAAISGRLGGLKDALAYAWEAFGLDDVYNSDTKTVWTTMNPVGHAGGGSGRYARDGRDICRAVRLAGSGEFLGPAASPQVFWDGAVIVQQGSDTRLVQPGVFRNTYTHPDGSEIALDEVPVAGDACQDVSGCRHM
jgi:hypothetical protein